MQIVSYSDLRRDMKNIMDRVQENHEPAIVTRKKDRHMVLMSLEDYNSIEETTYLLSNPVMRARLRKSIAEVNEGKVIHKSLKELGLNV